MHAVDALRPLADGRVAAVAHVRDDLADGFDR